MHDIILFLQQHSVLSTCLMIILLLLILLEFIKNKSQTHQLTPNDAVRLINHEHAIVVDIRNADAFANGHIIHAHSHPLKTLSSTLKKLEKFKSHPIIITCANGTDSSRAMTILTAAGFEKVYSLKNGLPAWIEAEMPITRS